MVSCTYKTRKVQKNPCRVMHSCVVTSSLGYSPPHPLPESRFQSFFPSLLSRCGGRHRWGAWAIAEKQQFHYSCGRINVDTGRMRLRAFVNLSLSLQPRLLSSPLDLCCLTCIRNFASIFFIDTSSLCLFRPDGLA